MCGRELLLVVAKRPRTFLIFARCALLCVCSAGLTCVIGHRTASGAAYNSAVEPGAMPMKVVLAACVILSSVATSAFAQNYSAHDLARRTVERRAVEAVIWGIPAVNYDLMLQAAIGAQGKANQVVYWSRLPDWKNQTLTPNPDVIYLMPLFDTKDVGPMVLEIPAAGTDGSITGSID